MKELFLEEAEAIKFVLNNHNISQTYDEFPYLVHLLQVRDTLVEFGYQKDRTLRLSSILHDVIEDAAVSYNDIVKLFGEDIADVVYSVTDELGRNRKERHEKTYPKLSKYPKGITLKLADRIANMRWGKATNSKMNTLYKKEYPEFKKALYNENHFKFNPNLKNLWLELDELNK